MNNLKNDTLLPSNTKILLGGYHYFVDYDTLLNYVSSPSIKLFGEYVYLDENERTKFENKKLGYLVDFFHRHNFDIDNSNSINYKLKERFLCSKIYLYIKPKLYIEGITDYGKIYNGIFTKHNFYTNDITESIDFLIENFNLFDRELDNYYNNLKSFEELNNKLIDGVYFYNFNLYSEFNDPSGSVTFSDRINYLLKINLNKDFLNEYYDSSDSSLNKNNYKLEFNIIFKNYNILIFENQSPYLIFNDK